MHDGVDVVAGAARTDSPVLIANGDLPASDSPTERAAPPPEGARASPSSLLLPALPPAARSWLAQAAGDVDFDLPVHVVVPAGMTVREDPPAATLPDRVPDGEARLAQAHDDTIEDTIDAAGDGAPDYFMPRSLGDPDDVVTRPATTADATQLARKRPRLSPARTRHPYALLALAFAAGAVLATAASWLLSRARCAPAAATPVGAPAARHATVPSVGTEPSAAASTSSPVASASAASALAARAVAAPALATLSIPSPRHATVSLDGEPRGPTPLTLRLPRYRRYQLEVTTAAGAARWRKQVYLRDAVTEVRFLP
jgi:hypothetical protein